MCAKRPKNRRISAKWARSAPKYIKNLVKWVRSAPKIEKHNKNGREAPKFFKNPLSISGPMVLVGGTMVFGRKLGGTMVWWYHGFKTLNDTLIQTTRYLQNADDQVKLIDSITKIKISPRIRYRFQ